MTLQQLKYVITVAETGNITLAAKELFIAQPSLTKAIKELEKEMGITIFARSKNGISVTKEGERFLGYARQVLEQVNLLEEEYKSSAGIKQELTISTQHYSFAVKAFVDLVKSCDNEKYDDERSGGFEPLKYVSGDKKVVLGLVTTKRAELEDKETIIKRIHEASQYVPLDRLYLSPQCGFSSNEIGNKITEDDQWAKLQLVKEIAEEVWG